VWPVKKADVCLTGNHLPKYIFLLVIAYWFVCMFVKPTPRPKFSVTSEGSSSTSEGVNLPPQLSRKSNTKNKLIVKLMLTWLTVVIRMLERGKPGTAAVATKSTVAKKTGVFCRRFVAGSFDFVDRVAIDIVAKVEHDQFGRLCRKWVICVARMSNVLSTFTLSPVCIRGLKYSVTSERINLSHSLDEWCWTQQTSPCAPS